MAALRELFWRVRHLFHRRRIRDDLNEEMAFHLQLRADKLEAEGAESPTALARRRFGNTTRLREEGLEVWRWSIVDEVVQDTRFALRSWWKRPYFTVTAILTLALGVGVNSTTFSLVDYLMFRPRAHVSEPERLVHLPSIRNFANFLNMRERSRSMDVAAYRGAQMSLGLGTDARPASAEFVSYDYFELLGARPALGRWFAPEEETPTSLSAVAVLSHRLWRRQFSAASDVLGQTIQLNGTSYTVVGVAPAGFTGALVNPVDVWLVFSANPVLIAPESLLRPNGSWHSTVGRLREGVTFDQAAADGSATELDTLPGVPPPEFRLQPFGDLRLPNSNVRDRAVAAWLFAAAATVFLIGCANVSGLLLVRTSERGHEMAVRSQLGAGKTRLLRQLLTESMVLAPFCGAVGTLVAFWTAPVVHRFFVVEPGGSSVLDGRVLALTFGLAFMATMLIGAAPAAQTLRVDISRALKSNRTGSRHGSRVRTGFLTAQVMLTFVLVVGAGLFVRSLDRVRALDFGWDPNVWVLTTDLQVSGYSAREMNARYRQLLERAQAMPDVERGALDVSMPVGGGIAGGFLPPESAGPRLPFLHAVTPDYLATVGSLVVRGRGFTSDDTAGSPGVVLVMRRTAERYWPGLDPLDQCLWTFGRSECFSVVGLVENSRWGVANSRDTGPDTVFVPLDQAERIRPIFVRALLLRLSGDPRAAERVLAELRASDANLPYLEGRPLWSLLDRQTRSWRLGSTLFSFFGALAIVLAAVGIYGVLAFSVNQRRLEVGIRKALGAVRSDILALLIREGALIVGVGCALGLGVALMATQFLEGQLFGVTATDPTSFVFSLLAVSAVAGGACIVPAVRATRVDPAAALQHEP